MEDHAYEQGYEQGEMNNDGGGYDDMGGGDMGGGARAGGDC